MKKADMVVGDEYAVSQTQSGWGYGIKRVRILETGVERKSGYGYPARSVNDGVRVVYLNTDRKGDFDLSTLRTRYDYPEIIRAQNVKATWAAYQAHLGAVERSRTERKILVAEELNRLEHLAAAANAKLGEEVFRVSKGHSASSMPFLEGSIDAIAEKLAET